MPNSPCAQRRCQYCTQDLVSGQDGHRVRYACPNSECINHAEFAVSITEEVANDGFWKQPKGEQIRRLERERTLTDRLGELPVIKG